eukprot:6169320-Pyramimonas_sp.AAC.1
MPAPPSRWHSLARGGREALTCDSSSGDRCIHCRDGWSKPRTPSHVACFVFTFRRALMGLIRTVGRTRT